MTATDCSLAKFEQKGGTHIDWLTAGVGEAYALSGLFGEGTKTTVDGLGQAAAWRWGLA